MLGARTGSTRDLDVHVVELVRNLGTATSQVVVESDQKFRPGIRVFGRQGDVPRGMKLIAVIGASLALATTFDERAGAGNATGANNTWESSAIA